LKITSRVDVKVLPRGTPALSSQAHTQGLYRSSGRGISRASDIMANQALAELRQSRGGLVLILSTRSPKNSPVWIA
jgi:hypothetical protein